MYDEFFPDNTIIVNKKLPYFLTLLFQSCEGLFQGDKCSKYADWVKAFVENHPNYPAKKDYFTSSKANVVRLAENFESWGFRADPL